MFLKNCVLSRLCIIFDKYMAVIVNTKTTFFLCHVLTDSVTSFLLWSQTKSWFLLFSCCCGLTAFLFWLFVTCIFCILFFFSSGGSLLFIEVCLKNWSICICAGADHFMMKPKSGGLIQTIATWSRPHSIRVWTSTMTILPRALALAVKTSGLGTRRPLGTCERCNVHDFQRVGSPEET